ncbi:hypothetical protein DV735_g3183, partial [Chaetothyriales sp. CBS 134920]
MDFQYTGWRSHSPDSIYSQQSQYHSPIASSLSSASHRRPPPPRVVKPTSRNGSPRHVGRRSTTTNVPVTRTRSVLDQQRSNPYLTSTPNRNTRPLSWHPNSQMDLNFSNQEYLMNMTYQPYFQPYTFHGTTLANGLVTPMSYPVLNEPQIQELITPLEELSAQEGAGYPTHSYNNYQNWAQPELPKDQMKMMDHMCPPTEPQPMWQWSHQNSTLDPPTAPSSPDFLPIQGGFDTRKEEEGEELVGMGLYDSPAEVQSSSLLFGGSFGAAPKPKSLKLAESFEPPGSNGVFPIYVAPRPSRPWQTSSELAMIRDWFYPQRAISDPYAGPEPGDMRQRAADQVRLYVFKDSKTPHALVATAYLAEALVHDQQPHRKEYISNVAMMSIYAMAFVKFVNGFVDRDVVGSVKASLSLESRSSAADAAAEHPNERMTVKGGGEGSMYAHAAKINMPQEFVDLRHQIVHGRIPDLSVLRRETEQALEWLWDKWWKTNATGDPTSALRAREEKKRQEEEIRQEWESPSTFYHPRQEPGDGASRFQTALTSLALIALGYWILNFLDAWPPAFRRRLYEIIVYLIPSQAIYSLQALMARLTRMSHEDLTFHRADFGNQQAKSDALQRMISHSPFPQAIRKVRSGLPAVDTILRPSAEPGPPGLGNWDNSCYQNSILQGLASLPEFQKYIGQSLALCDRLALPAATHRALAEFLAQLSSTANARETLWTPIVLKSMDSWNQQDAQEYFTKVLDAVEKEASKYTPVLQKRDNPGLATLPGTISSGSQATSLLKRVSLNESRAKPGQTLEQELSIEASPPGMVRSPRARAATLLPYKCPVDGMFAQALVCQECGFSEGYSLTQFNSLTLNMGLRGNSRLVDLLDEFTDPEMVEGVECTECTKEASDSADKAEAGQDTEADQPSPSKRPKLKPVLRTKAKQITLGRLPKDLVLHINRSIFDEYGNQRKNLSMLQFPARLQVPSRWCAPLAGDDEEHIVATYELRCSVTHYGRHENGHYVAFGQRGKDWYCFNDEIVTKMDEEEVLSRGNVFMLFYEMVPEGPTREDSPERSEAPECERKEAPPTRSPSSSSEEDPASPVLEPVIPIVPVPALRTATGGLKTEQSVLRSSPAIVFDADASHRRKSSLVVSEDPRPEFSQFAQRRFGGIMSAAERERQKSVCIVHKMTKLDIIEENTEIPDDSGTKTSVSGEATSVTSLSAVREEVTAPHSRLLTKQQLSNMALSVRELAKRLSNLKVKMKIRSVFLLTKVHDVTLIRKTRDLVQWLLSKERSELYIVYVEDTMQAHEDFDATGLLKEDPSYEERLRYWNTELARNQPHTFDIAVTLGGDGTVLYASALFQKVVPPVLSFALGSLGFLTKFDFNDYESILTRAFRDGLIISLRLRFETTVMRSLRRGTKDLASLDLVEELLEEEVEGKHTHKPDRTFEILNDVVVDRGPNPTMSTIELFGDTEHLTTVQADGICVATPTGSTAYNLAAGGSLCHPDNPVILVTAICAHTLSFRPIILPDTIVLRLGVPYDARSSSWASFDGRERVELFPGDYITISASRYPFAIVMPSGRSSEEWVGSISRTLQWNSRQRQKAFQDWTETKEVKAGNGDARPVTPFTATGPNFTSPPRPSSQPQPSLPSIVSGSSAPLPDSTSLSSLSISKPSTAAGGLRVPYSRKTIYDRHLNRSRNAESSRSAFAFLFMEMVAYAHKRVTGIQDFEKRLNEQGYMLGSNSSSSGGAALALRPLRLLPLLNLLTTKLYPLLFSRPADSLEQSTTEPREYMIIDNTPLTNTYISVPKEMNQLSVAAYIAGVIEGVCDASGFEAKVTSHNQGTDVWPNRTVFLLRFDDAVLEREKELDRMGVK